MIDWVDDMGKAWGWQWRVELARPAACAKSWWPKLVERAPSRGEFEQEFLLGRALEFHCAFRALPYKHRVLLANHYVDPAPTHAKARALGVATRSWWRRLHAAHLAVAGLLSASP